MSKLQRPQALRVPSGTPLVFLLKGHLCSQQKDFFNNGPFMSSGDMPPEPTRAAGVASWPLPQQECRDTPGGEMGFGLNRKTLELIRDPLCYK